MVFVQKVLADLRFNYVNKILVHFDEYFNEMTHQQKIYSKTSSKIYWGQISDIRTMNYFPEELRIRLVRHLWPKRLRAGWNYHEYAGVSPRGIGDEESLPLPPRH